ncbi:MAG: phosphomethylpyrimidine synthase ThiC [Elusimicrobiales bacterium]
MKYTDEFARREIFSGRAVMTANPNHKGVNPCVIGAAFGCKVNVNLGASAGRSGWKAEKAKLRIALECGADTVMDLSTGCDLKLMRRMMLENSPVPVGTVPVYEALARAGSPENLTEQLILDVIEEQAEQGVDFMTVHSGLLLEHLPHAEKRITGIVSRGGAILARHMRGKNRQNPFYSAFDRICEIARRRRVCLSLGDGLRPGCLADACDKAQFAELETLGGLVLRARRAGAQVMVEGPGHIPMHKVAMNVRKADKICRGAPFYVLGPLVTDIAPGYDHITSAIGAALAAREGASLLCCVTPREHLGLPDEADIRQGVIAYKIAAHAADIARGVPHARERDDEMSKARFAFDWERQFSLALDPETARAMRAAPPGDGECCTMCGPDFCAMRLYRRKNDNAANDNARCARNTPRRTADTQHH